MKKNRQILYLFLFLIAVAAFAVNGKAGTTVYSPETVTKYTNSLRVGIENILRQVPLQTMEEEKTLQAKKINRSIGGVDQVLSSYIELKEIGFEFEFYDAAETKTEEILENIFTSIYEQKDNGTERLTESQIAAYKEVYIYLYELHQIDMYDMELGELLREIEKVSVNHAELADQSF